MKQKSLAEEFALKVKTTTAKNSWSREHINYLTEHWEKGTPFLEMAEAMDRTSQSVYNKGIRLGLHETFPRKPGNKGP